MMVHARRRCRVIRFQTFARARVIGAIYLDRRALLITREHVIGAVKRQTLRQKSEAPRHRVCVNADNIVTHGSKHASECDLGADAIAVGPGVADDRDGAAGQFSSQPAKSLR